MVIRKHLSKFTQNYPTERKDYGKVAREPNQRVQTLELSRVQKKYSAPTTDSSNVKEPIQLRKSKAA